MKPRKERGSTPTKAPRGRPFPSGPANKGRAPGTPNKTTAEVRSVLTEIVSGRADKAGAVIDRCLDAGDPYPWLKACQMILPAKLEIDAAGELRVAVFALLQGKAIEDSLLREQKLLAEAGTVVRMTGGDRAKD